MQDSKPSLPSDWTAFFKKHFCFSEVLHFPNGSGLEASANSIGQALGMQVCGLGIARHREEVIRYLLLAVPGNEGLDIQGSRKALRFWAPRSPVRAISPPGPVTWLCMAMPLGVTSINVSAGDQDRYIDPVLVNGDGFDLRMITGMRVEMRKTDHSVPPTEGSSEEETLLATIGSEEISFILVSPGPFHTLEAASRNGSRATVLPQKDTPDE